MFECVLQVAVKSAAMKNLKLMLAFLIVGLLVGVIMTSAIAQVKPQIVRAFIYNQEYKFGTYVRYYEDKQAGLCFVSLFEKGSQQGSHVLVPCTPQVKAAASQLTDWQEKE
ncbi:MAG TPA: hypothetical protein VF571_09420 [Pyrinomonadaceae bacterium]